MYMCINFILQGQIFGPFQNVNTPNIVNILLLGIGGDYFGPHDGDYFEDYPFASYLIFVGFMIIVTVLFNNLLVRYLYVHSKV